MDEYRKDREGVFYVYDDQQRHRGVIVYNPKTQLLGWSFVHPNDLGSWDRKRGLRIARGRSMVVNNGRRYRMLTRIPPDYRATVLAYVREYSGLG